MTTAPYIPTDAECGTAWRTKLGLPDVATARITDHPMMGSHIRGECFVCEQPKTAAVHGPIHLVADGAFACDPQGRAGVTAPMSQRTLRRDHVTCPGCVEAFQ